MPHLARQFDDFIKEIVDRYCALELGDNIKINFKKIINLKIERKDSYALILNRGVQEENVGWSILLAINGISSEKIKNYILPSLNEELGLSVANLEEINNDNGLIDTFCKIFTEGYTDGVVKKILADEPIILRRFNLSNEILLEVKDNRSKLSFLLENKYVGRLGQKIGDYVEDEILGTLITGGYDRGVLDFLEPYYSRVNEGGNRNPRIDLIIPNKQDPKILVESSYTKTTASGQTKKIDANDALFSAIRNYNQANNKELIFVNFIDGAGWIARGTSDMRRFVDSCDYAINYNNLDLFKKVLSYYS